MRLGRPVLEKLRRARSAPTRRAEVAGRASTMGQRGQRRRGLTALAALVALAGPAGAASAADKVAVVARGYHVHQPESPHAHRLDDARHQQPPVRRPHAVRRRHLPAQARPRRVVDDQQGRARVRLQAAPGRGLPRRVAVHRPRRQVELGGHLPQGQPADRGRLRRPLRADQGVPGVPRRPGGGRRRHRGRRRSHAARPAHRAVRAVPGVDRGDRHPAARPVRVDPRQGAAPASAVPGAHRHGAVHVRGLEGRRPPRVEGQPALLPRQAQARRAHHPVHPGPGRAAHRVQERDAPLRVLLAGAHRGLQRGQGPTRGSWPRPTPACGTTSPPSTTPIRSSRTRACARPSPSRSTAGASSTSSGAATAPSSTARSIPSLPAFDKKVAAPEYDPAKAKGAPRRGGLARGERRHPREGRQALRVLHRQLRGAVAGAWPSSTRTPGRSSGWTSPSTPSTSPRSGACASTPGSSRPSASSGPRASTRTPRVGLYPFLCANSRSGYCSAEMDRLIVAGRSTLNPQERLKTYARFQELFARDAAVHVGGEPGRSPRSRARS